MVTASKKEREREREREREMHKYILPPSLSVCSWGVFLFFPVVTDFGVAKMGVICSPSSIGSIAELKTKDT